MNKKVGVIGLGRFGSQVAISLAQKGFDVLAIDLSEETITELKDVVTRAVILDATDEKAMRAVQVDNLDMAVVAFGNNVQESLLSVALLQKLGIESIYVRSINALQEGILRSMGITQMINIEEEMGRQLSSTLASGKVGRYIQLSDKHSLTELSAPKKLVGKTLKQLNFREKYRINVVAIKKSMPCVDDQGDVKYVTEMFDLPDPEQSIKENDLLMILGHDDYVKQFIEMDNDEI